jgi:transcriptional regulator with XRE-family HTH domain
MCGALTIERPPGNSLDMDYTQLFRSLREAKGFTLEALARLARVHRNTIVNIESGRAVKFKTIAALMQKMGYPASSPQMKSIALLWLESISGIPFSRTEAEATARKSIASYRSTSRDAARELAEAAAQANLTAQQIRVLLFAVRNPEVISIVEHVRDVTTQLAATSSDVALLRAAEDAGKSS